MFKLRKSDIKSLIFVIILTCVYGLLFLMSDFYDIPFRGFSDFLNLSAQFLVIVFPLLLLYDVFLMLHQIFLEFYRSEQEKLLR